MRRGFEITDEQVALIKEASSMDQFEAISYLAEGEDPNVILLDRVNAAWIKLGNELGFSGMTAQPIGDNYDDYNHFTAEVKPCEKNLN